MKKECIAMLLAGGQGSRLQALTDKAAKPNMSFGGKYRIIDFPLSNCANSGIDVVGVLTQYQPLQLNSYIGSGQAWDLDIQSGGVYILPPYQSAGAKGKWFSGTANAIYQNINFVDMWDPKYVVVLSGDHIYKMDYSDMLQQHKEHNADCTIAVLRVPLEDATRFGIMDINDEGYINKFTEKPKEPQSDLASMGIYIFTWSKLRQYLIDDENNQNSENDFGKNIIPAMLNNGEKLWPYRFSGYWRDVGTIDSLWDANMDMLCPERINLFDANWPIRSRSPIKPPQYIGVNVKVNRSILTEGCEIRGDVQESVIGSSVAVGEGAKIIGSVLTPGCKVGKNAVVEYAIIGENAVIGEGAVVGSSSHSGGHPIITTCGPNTNIEAGSVVYPGSMIHEGKEND